MREEIIVKVEGEEWKKLIDKAFDRVIKKAHIDGFRDGKAPRSVYEKKYGIGELLEEALDSAIQNKYTEVINEGKIIPVMQPKVDVVSLDENGMEAKLIFITSPKVTLGDYTKLDVKKEDVIVSKEEVEEAIKHLQDDYAEKVSKEGKIEEGDTAVIDYEGFKDGVAFDGGKGEDFELVIGSHTFIPGFEEGLIGLAKDDEKDLELTFPEDYHSEELKGAKVVFKVKVKDVMTREVPELDEDFFADLGMDDINSKKDLEKKVEEELKEEKEKKIEGEYIDAIIKKAIENTEFEMDPEFYHEEAHSMYHEMIHNMSRYGIKEEEYLKYNNTTEEDIIKNFEEEAKFRVQGRLMISEIINNKKFDVTEEELENKIKELCEKHNVSKEELLSEKDAKEMLKSQILFDKVIDFLKN